MSSSRSSEGSAHDHRIALIIERIRRIPKGSVQTYGGIDPAAPRLVGHVLATIRVDVPWHRVVRADGSIAKGKRQRDLLLKEGVAMRGDRVDLKRSRVGKRA
jgi:alkylated DNA nucleotide flippase Atl1